MWSVFCPPFCRCFAHCTNLALKAVLRHRSAQAIVKKAARVVKYIRASTLRLDAFDTECASCNPPLPKKRLPLYTPTRWFSATEMLVVLVAYEKPLLNFFRVYDSRNDRQREEAEEQEDGLLQEGEDDMGENLSFEGVMPGPVDFEMWRHLVGLLKPFQKEQARLEASRNPTLGMAVPAYNRLISALELPRDAPFADAAAAAKDVLEAYYGRTSEYYTVATVLDPRYKTWYYKKDTTEGAVPAVIIEGTVRQFLTPYLGAPGEGDVGGLVLADEVPDESFAGIPIGELISDELSAYLNEYAAAPQTNPLEWWATIGGRFPKLQRAAKDYMAVPATSAPAERAFSKGRQTVSEFRHSLDPLMIEALELLQSWQSQE